MALVINILPPLTTPTFSVARVPAGGNFTAGTYTFGIFLDGSTTTGQHLSFASRLSPCVEQTIVLQANDGVAFTWGSLDAAGYRIFAYCLKTLSAGRLDFGGTDGGYSYSIGWNKTTYPTGLTITQNTWDVRGENYNNYEVTNFFFGLNPSKGIGKIQVISDVNYSVNDIIVAIKASAMVKGDDYVVWTNCILTTYSLDLSGCTNAAIFTITGAMLYFAGGIFMSGTGRIVGAATTAANTCILSSKHGGYGTSGTISNATLAGAVFGYLYMNYIGADGVRYGDKMAGGSWNISGTGSTYACFYQQNYGGFPALGMDTLSITSVVNFPSSNINQPIRQKTITSHTQTYSGYMHKVFKNQEFFCSNTSYQLFHTGDGVYSNSFLDCNWYLNQVKILRPAEYIYTYAISYGNSKTFHGNTINIKITDLLGNALNNVNIKLYDKNNTLIFSVNTDINGIIATQDVYWYSVELIGTVYPGGSETALNCIATNFNPYRMEITKDGYESYNPTGITINDKINQVIELKPVVQIRIGTRGVLLAANPEAGSDSNLIEV